jgi:hypothetical protein
MQTSAISKENRMRSPLIFMLLAISASVAGCNTMTPAQIASVSCAGAQAGAAVAVTVTTDANTGANATKAAAQAQQTAATIQQTISDTCPIIIQGVNAVNAAATGSGAASN